MVDVQSNTPTPEVLGVYPAYTGRLGVTCLSKRLRVPSCP